MVVKYHQQGWKENMNFQRDTISKSEDALSAGRGCNVMRRDTISEVLYLDFYHGYQSLGSVGERK